MRELDADSLREIAAWLDVLDEFALNYLDLLEVFKIHDSGELLGPRQTLRGTEIQDDLRRWADEMEQA